MGQIGKSKIQIPNSKQIPRSQIPKPGDWLPRWNLEFGVYLDFGFWNFAHGMETFDASAPIVSPDRQSDTVLAFDFSIFHP
jgi:hypothetical protein